VDPSQAEAWRRLMMARRGAKDGPAAAEAAERLLALLPDDLQGLMTSAVLQAALGNDALARERLQRALDLDPDRVRARSQQDVELAALLARLPGR
jgi:predicted TPR repeat methyltransferase